MPLVMIPGGGMWMPKLAAIQSFGTTGLIDATGEKFAAIGPVWTPTGGTKSIRKVGFRFGTVVKAGGSALTVSLQDVDATTGPPWRPDETQDQTVAIANANAAFVSNTWIQTANLSADRSVTFGSMLAVVVEFDGAGRLGADSVIINSVTAQPTHHGSGTVLKTGGTWAALSMQPNLVLEFSDGTFGNLMDSQPLSVLASTATINTGTTPDEVALEFQVPWQCQVDGAYLAFNTATASDYDMILYDSDGNTALTNGTVSVDSNQIFSSAGLIAPRLFPGLVTLLPNTTYKLALKPTTANSMAYYFKEVNAAGYWTGDDGGPTWAFASRTDAGAWTTVTTRRPIFGLHFVSFNDAGGSHFIGG